MKERRKAVGKDAKKRLRIGLSFWTEGIVAMKTDNGLDATIQYVEGSSNVVSLQLWILVVFDKRKWTPFVSLYMYYCLLF